MSDHDTALWVEQLSVDIAVSNGTLHAVRQVDFRLERGRTLFLVVHDSVGVDGPVAAKGGQNSAHPSGVGG